MPTARLTDFFAKRLRDEDELDGMGKHKKHKENNKSIEVKEGKQMFLDLGQALHITCRVCGMCYDPSFKADTLKHTKHHASFIRVQGEQEIKLPNKAMPFLDEPFKMAGLRLMVFEASALKTIQKVIERINDEFMSAAPIDFDDISDGWRVYFVTGEEESIIVGFALVQPIQEAFRSRPHADPSMVCELTNESVPASIGVSRIWVAPRMRSRGIGRQLLESIRETFARPVVASKAMLAFSQPTLQGYQLAKAYLGSIDVLVYK